MIVYAVIHSDYEDSSLHSIFSTRDKAKKMLHALNGPEVMPIINGYSDAHYIIKPIELDTTPIPDTGSYQGQVIMRYNKVGYCSPIRWSPGTKIMDTENLSGDMFIVYGNSSQEVQGKMEEIKAKYGEF
jgi:hypothetical protein